MDPWHLANEWGILTGGAVDDADAAFNAGHLNDVLILDEGGGFTTVLVASDTGGVWLVNESGGAALPLTDRFQSPDMNALAQGPRSSRHVYAGGTLLYETDVTRLVPLLSWQPIAIADGGGNLFGAGAVRDILALRDISKLVLACDNGIFWADIPSVGAPYVFQQVVLMPVGAYSGLAEGPNNAVIAAAWGSGGLNHFGLFLGSWSGGVLVFTRSSIWGSVNPSLMLRTSVDSCRNNRSSAYAVAAGVYRDKDGNIVNDTIYCVLKTKDGGKTWTVAGSKVNGETDPLFGNPATNLPGNQGDYNNCIAVSPFDFRAVAVGWRGGYFVSRDEAKTWDYFRADSPHMHSDLHALAFSQFDDTNRTVYVCSDGGLAITRDGAKTYSSQCNRQLPNLQFTRVATSYPKSGLIAGSLQDNGDGFALLYPSSQPWLELEGGDGTETVFLRTGDILHYNNTLTVGTVEFGNRVRQARWNDSKSVFEDQKYFPDDPLSRGVIPVDGTSDGLPFPVCEFVNNPLWENWAHEKMMAVAGKDAKVYGLFQKSSSALHWAWLLDISTQKDNNGNPVENISAVGSSDGSGVFVGTNLGNVHLLTAPVPPDVNWGSVDIGPGTPALPVGSVQRFIIQSDDLVFFIATGQQLWKLQRPIWTQLAAPLNAQGDYTAIDTDWTIWPKTLFIATDTRVYSSGDDGATWTDISNGLPETPHCRHLSFVTEESKARFLYLGTYGRSVYRVLLNATEQQNHNVTIDGGMDIVDRQAFGHDIWSHPGFSNIVTLGPYHPVEDLTYIEDDGDEVRVELKVHLQWFLDESVRADYTAKLISKDEDDAVEDQNSGTFHLARGASHKFIVDLASDEFWPDRAHIEFTVTD